MKPDILAGTDFAAAPQPEASADHRALLEGWLRYQRHEFVRKLRDLDADGLAAWSIPPVELSVLGLVRHMTQMEHAYLEWGLGGGDLAMPYGDEDYAGGSPETVDEDLRRYFAAVGAGERAVAAVASLDDPGAGNGRPLSWALVKMIDEYALHAGQAHMLRYAALGEVRR